MFPQVNHPLNFAHGPNMALCSGKGYKPEPIFIESRDTVFNCVTQQNWIWLERLRGSGFGGVDEVKKW